MFIGLTGTPGTGKSSVAQHLRKKGFYIVDLNALALDNNCIAGFDQTRQTKIIDIDKLNHHITNNYQSKNTVFFEGHFAHLLPCIEKVIILRCHPQELKRRLTKKGWNQKKITENVEAEILDIILCEAVELYQENDIFEIDTTKKSTTAVLTSIIEIIENVFHPLKKYKIGNIDWSEEILKNKQILGEKDGIR